MLRREKNGKDQVPTPSGLDDDDDDNDEMMKGYRDVVIMRKWVVGGRLALVEGLYRLLVEGRSLCRVVMCKRLAGSEFAARKCRQGGIRCLDQERQWVINRSS
jgi:hypothetical protein